MESARWGIAVYGVGFTVDGVGFTVDGVGFTVDGVGFTVDGVWDVNVARTDRLGIGRCHVAPGICGCLARDGRGRAD